MARDLRSKVAIASSLTALLHMALRRCESGKLPMCPSRGRLLLRLLTSFDVVLRRFRDKIGVLPIAARAHNGRTANARGTGLHAWLDDKLAMKAVSAMLTKCDSSIALTAGDFKGVEGPKPNEKPAKMGGLSALAGDAQGGMQLCTSHVVVPGRVQSNTIHR